MATEEAKKPKQPSGKITPHKPFKQMTSQEYEEYMRKAERLSAQ